MKKILYVTTISNTINAFLVKHILFLKNNGYDVGVACSLKNEIDEKLIEEGVRVHIVPYNRNPLKISNLKAANQIKMIVNENNYDIVHVHTPVAAFYSRLFLRKEAVEVVYTCHGFHFYKGAPIINWLIYYPLEKIASRWTDVIVTINKEDYNNAKRMKLRGKNKVFLMKSVGIDPNKYYTDPSFDRDKYRQKIGVDENDFMILILAEINNNKNHIQVIKAMELLKEDNLNIKVICAGKGKLINKLQKIVSEKGLRENIRFIGFRKGVKELIECSDCIALFSKREGLGKCLLEGMIMHKPVIATNTRGPRELVKNEKNGLLVGVGDIENTAKIIKRLYNNEELRVSFGEESEIIAREFYLENVLNKLNTYY
ncbi:glycosyltransferase family 4 protein [Clostridium paraputrificum]|uniref:glycosyltransferase family 4 protein n=1 Tax=Clostridium paraputrificum TaxID=29363 RepID=UPI00325C17E9